MATVCGGYAGAVWRHLPSGQPRLRATSPLPQRVCPCCQRQQDALSLGLFEGDTAGTHHAESPDRLRRSTPCGVGTGLWTLMPGLLRDCGTGARV